MREHANRETDGAVTSRDVLLVDDDAQFVETVKHYVEDANDVDVTAVTDPNEALSAVERGDVDCIVSDYKMPGMNGLELLEAVRSVDPDLPFILFTRHGNEEIASEAISAGVTDYLRKGDDEQFALLSNRIENAIGRVESQRELRAEKERFQRLVEEVKEYAIFLLDETGHIVTWNEGAKRVKGYTEAEVLGEHLSLFYPEESEDRVDYLLARARESGSIQDEGWRVRKDGSKFWANVTITATHDREGNLLGFSKVTRDMTDRREYERRIERKNRRLERVMSILNHDLRTPLNTAKARLDIGRERDDPEHFEVAKDALDRIEHLLDRLMLFARKGRIVSEAESVDLGEVVANAERTVNYDLNVMVADELPTVEGDEQRLQEMFENLLKNVGDHAGPTATVTVGTTNGGFYVEDDGDGVPETDRARVFDIGYTTGDDGTGFGLSIVKEIAEAHAWEVSVTESDAGGARFEFRE
ncbi:response regulator [Haloplanus sp. GCM10025708]|uniref:response regulator n=1 Tax=Haloferacaceae TaxID=1644056 RepID=UPI0036184867